MEEKKRTLLAVVISCIIMLAVVYSFGLNFLRSTPEVIVADPDLDSSQSEDLGLTHEGSVISIEVTPETVQSVINSMTRYKSYNRTVEIQYSWGEGESSQITAQIWSDAGWSRCDAVLASGITERSILGDGSLWYWYDESTEYLVISSDENQGDLVQYIPTYEDVLRLDAADIFDAGYTEKNGGPCIYLETYRSELGYLERYWVSVTSGLLVAAETEKDGVVVYSMTSGDIVSPLAGATDAFTLPDGTVLHRTQN